MTRSKWGLGAIIGAVLIALALILASVSGGSQGSKTTDARLVASFTVTTNVLTASFDASGSTDSIPHGKLDVYTWNFDDGSATDTGKTIAHPYTKAGVYKVSLIVSDHGKVSKPFFKSVAVSTINLVALEDPGPGNCVPGNSILANLRKQKPGGEDYQPPYDTAELKMLSSTWVAWITKHESASCVRAMATFAGVEVAHFPTWLRSNATLKEVDSDGLTVQNSYFDHTSGSITWWHVQTFPQGELIWKTKAGKPMFKFVCGNALRLIPPPHKSPPPVIPPKTCKKLGTCHTSTPTPTPTPSTSTPKCPPGTTGTPPNCHTRKCPPGQIGTLPNCTAKNGAPSAQPTQPGSATGTNPAPIPVPTTDSGHPTTEPTSSRCYLNGVPVPPGTPGAWCS